MPYKDPEKAKESAKRSRLKNREKRNKWHRDYYMDNIEKERERSREKSQKRHSDAPALAKDSRLKWAYGISLEQYNQMLISQDNVCIICLKSETVINSRTGKVNSLAVDHDHKTGKVRGLLCGACNTAIGLVKEDKLILNNMVKYLIDHDS